MIAGAAAAAAVLAVLLLAGVGSAAAPDPATNPCTHPHVTNFLAADASHLGVITLYFFHADGARVSYFECVGGKARPLGRRVTPAGTPTILRDATTWSCSRLGRHFVATATLPDGSPAEGQFGVRTLSCARRFDLRVPRTVKPGRPITVRAVDRWSTGDIHTRLCVTPPRERTACSPLVFRRKVALVTRSVPTHVRGSWRLELRAGGHRVRATVGVGTRAASAKPLPILLATGDSMMQGTDGFLADDLGAAVDVRSDVRPGTAIGKGDQWLRWSAAQVAQQHPDATVVAIGANEGFPMVTPAGATVDCCGEPWVAEYSRRVATMMRTYLRGGHGRVVWLTLPAPREGRLTPIFAAVNSAVLRAGSGVAGVTILRIDEIFSPHGYRDVMRYGGRSVRVREPDGVHLNIVGTAIAAKAIVQVLATHR